MIACFFLRITTIAVAIKTDDEICSKFAVKTNVYETKWSHDYIHWFQSINYKWCTYSKIFIWLCYLKFIDIYGSIFHLYWKFSTRFLLSLLKTRLHKWSNFQFYYHWQFPAVQPIKSWHYYFESFCHRSYWFYCRQKWFELYTVHTDWVGNLLFNERKCFSFISWLSKRINFNFCVLNLNGLDHQERLLNRLNEGKSLHFIGKLYHSLPDQNSLRQSIVKDWCHLHHTSAAGKKNLAIVHVSIQFNVCHVSKFSFYSKFNFPIRGIASCTVHKCLYISTESTIKRKNICG